MSLYFPLIPLIIKMRKTTKACPTNASNDEVVSPEFEVQKPPLWVFYLFVEILSEVNW